MNGSNYDIQRTIESVLCLRPDMSDDAIAVHYGVSRELVQQLRTSRAVVADEPKSLAAPPPEPVDSSKECPNCHARAVWPSHRGVFGLLAILLWLRPFRCHRCGWRFYRSRRWSTNRARGDAANKPAITCKEVVMHFKDLLVLLRARWRWIRGRCPRCSRYLNAPFRYSVTAYPNCVVCKDEHECDLHMWHVYRSWRASSISSAMTPHAALVPSNGAATADVDPNSLDQNGHSVDENHRASASPADMLHHESPVP